MGNWKLNFVLKCVESARCNAMGHRSSKSAFAQSQFPLQPLQSNVATNCCITASDDKIACQHTIVLHCKLRSPQRHANRTPEPVWPVLTWRHSFSPDVTKKGPTTSPRSSFQLQSTTTDTSGSGGLRVGCARWPLCHTAAWRPDGHTATPPTLTALSDQRPAGEEELPLTNQQQWQTGAAILIELVLSR